MRFFLVQVLLSTVALTVFAVYFSVLDYFLPGVLFITLPLSVFFSLLTALPILALTNRIARVFLKQKTGRHGPNETILWAVSSTSCDIAVNLTNKVSFTKKFPIGIYRLFGLKTGPGAVVEGGIWDPDIVELGSNVRISEEACISAHSIEYGILRRGRISIGDNSSIESYSVLWPGSRAGSNIYLRGCSVLPHNKSLEDDGLYEGIPAKLVKKKSK